MTPHRSRSFYLRQKYISLKHFFMRLMSLEYRADAPGPSKGNTSPLSSLNQVFLLMSLTSVSEFGSKFMGFQWIGSTNPPSLRLGVWLDLCWMQAGLEVWVVQACPDFGCLLIIQFKKIIINKSFSFFFYMYYTINIKLITLLLINN